VGGITSAQQLANLGPAKVVGTIPRQDQTNAQASVADNVVEAPLSVFSESVRRLRAAVDHAVINQPGRGKVVMIASSIPAEGKTSIAIALARTYAVAGKRTLLIDSDLRKPSVSKYLALEPKMGFLDYLRDPENFGNIESFYDVDPKSRAGIIMGRGRSAVPTDQLLQSATFESILENARLAMDITIIDSPPVVPVVDARYIAPHVDAVVICVRYGVTSQSDVREAYAQIADSVRPGTPILAVLNLDEGKMKSYRYSGYYADYAAG